MRKYFVFPKGFIVFFLVSHILSYFVSTLQTLVIIKEIRKSGE